MTVGIFFSFSFLALIFERLTLLLRKDKLKKSETVFELHLRELLPKTISKCRGLCGKPIAITDKLIVRSYGVSTWRSPKTHEEMSKYGPLYIHFKDVCLKMYDSNNYYAPTETFNYEKIKLDQNTREKLSKPDLDFLAKKKIM